MLTAEIGLNGYPVTHLHAASVFANGHNLSTEFVPGDNGKICGKIAVQNVYIGTANAASLYLDQNFTRAGLRRLYFLNSQFIDALNNSCFRFLPSFLWLVPSI